MARILIVDDLVSNRRALAVLLAAEGHAVLEAPNGSAGLALAQAEMPDLIITDVLMPVVNGYEFVRRLRLGPATAAIPVLFYTAPYGEREARALARAGGMPFVLTKPPEPAEVLKIVGRVLAGRMADEGQDALDAPADAASDLEQLQLVSDQLSETTEDLRLANARLRALLNIGLDFASQRESDWRLRRLCLAVQDLFCATYVTIGRLGRDDRRVERIIASDTDATSWIAAGEAVSGIFRTVVDERRPMRGIVPGEGRGLALGFPPSHPEVQAFLIVPIASPSHAYGWICLVGNEGLAFDDEQQHQLLSLAGHVGRIYELEHEIAERRQAEAALLASERLTRNLLEHLPHRILVKDRQSVVRFCNANLAADLHVRVEDVIGRNEFAFYPRHLAERYSAADRAVIESGVASSVDEPYEADGAERWAHTVRVPYRDEQGVVTGVLVVFEDITERRLREEQYQQAQKMETVGRLAGGVAHDFNNMLTAILGYCDLVTDSLEPSDARRADIAQIHRAASTAAALTKQLLAFSRKEMIEPTMLDLNVVVDGMQAMLRRLIREDVAIDIGLGSASGHVVADRSQVEQIVLNLALNARDAMPDGGTLTIGTSSVDLDERFARAHQPLEAGVHTALTVSDTGVGMTPDVKARIFEPFFTTKGAGRGTGLGLASVHGIIARSGGSVAVESAVGAGSIFTVYFPQTEAVAVPEVAAPPALVEQAGTETVLVVEDAPELRSLIERFLTRQGYTVLMAANAEEALHLFDAHARIDVLLTDVVLPGTSGPELSRQLVESRPDLKAIYMSGYAEDTIVQRGVLLPGLAFLSKPFTASQLCMKVRRTLDASPVLHWTARPFGKAEVDRSPPRI